MNVDPCGICGSTDMNLVDGYYYCVECGTQDANVQETIVDHTYADGTFTYLASKKFSTAIRDGVEMSGEWHKWHALNFIVCGLADELIALGAKPSFKMKLLWVWTRYIKKYQIKDAETTSELPDITKNDKPAKQKEYINETNYKYKSKSIQHITKTVIFTLLYIALNLDKSDIQLSHLIRFVKENRVSLIDCKKLVPKELNTRIIPGWSGIHQCFAYKVISRTLVRMKALSFFKLLDLGSPIVPDMRKIVENSIKELCLPDDFKNLVFSLMKLLPHNLEIGEDLAHYVRIPDYEVVAMSYILTALKMCFGLDGDYEFRVSDAVDKINEEMGYMQSHKLGLFPEPSDRLFSYREWCNYLQFRKCMLSKHFLEIAQQRRVDVDDYVFIDGLEPKHAFNKLLSDEITMDIINKIPERNDVFVIPRSKFPGSLTPMSTYTDVICQHTNDSDLKLLLSEDFTQYSLKYACNYLKLPTGDILTGVNTTNKVKNAKIYGTFILRKTIVDSTVFVRNCENKNWLKTKPPTLNHITKVNQNPNGTDRDGDLGYDSNTEIDNNKELDSNHNDIDPDRKLETVVEENSGKSIFDDEFDDVDVNETKNYNNATVVPDHFEFNTHDINNTCSMINNEDLNDSKVGILSSKSNDGDAVTFILPHHNPDTFNRDNIIKELILAKCKKYKIPVPTQNNPKESRKRKATMNTEAGHSEEKKKRICKKPGAAKEEINKLISMYYENLENDVLKKISDRVKAIVQTTGGQPQYDETHNESYNEDFDRGALENRSNGDLDIEENINIEHLTQDRDCNVNDTQTNLDPTYSDTDDEQDDDDINDIMPQVDPKFDEKTHDIKQLYVRIENDKNDDVFDVDNPVINEIVDVCPSTNSDKSNINDDLEKDTSTDEDDIPLSVLREDKKFLKYSNRNEHDKLEPILQDFDSIEKFNYWFRNYENHVLKCVDLNQRFDMDLEKNFPESFCFLITECSTIINTTNFSLYKTMLSIENMFTSHM